MTAKDLAVVVRGIAPVMREYVAGLVDRVKALEDRPVPQDGAQGPPGESIAGPKGDKGDPGERGLEGPAGLARDGRDGLPGGPGPAGEKGLDGQHGKDGRDGTLENLKAMFDGERTLTLCFKDGTPIEGGTISFPVMIYRGVHQEGRMYNKGDMVTWASSLWLVNETTNEKPADLSRAWTLCVKKGRDGKDGKDGEAGRPGRDLTKDDVAWRS